MQRTRTFGYILSPSRGITAEKTAIESYCQKAGRSFDGFYGDPRPCSKQRLFSCPAGGRMLPELKRGDHVVLASLNSVALPAPYLEDGTGRRRISRSNIMGRPWTKAE